MNVAPLPNPLQLFDTDHSITPVHFENDQAARVHCLERWPDAEFAFCYLGDLDEERAPANEALRKRIILNVVHKVADGFEGTVPTYGHIIGTEFDMEVWSDAYYYGQLADDVEANNEQEMFEDPS